MAAVKKSLDEAALVAGTQAIFFPYLWSSLISLPANFAKVLYGDNWAKQVHFKEQQKY
jgi:hypothetical protein